MPVRQSRLATKRRVFDAVFPFEQSNQTPQTSPYIGAPSSPIPSQEKNADPIATLVAQRIYSQDIVTQWLRSPFNSSTSSRKTPAGLDDALESLLQSDWTDSGLVVSAFTSTHRALARDHFDKYVKPRLDELWGADVPVTRARDVLEKTTATFAEWQEMALGPFNAWSREHSKANSSSKFLRTCLTEMRKSSSAELITICRLSIDYTRLSSTITYILYEVLTAASKVFSNSKPPARDQALITGLYDVGLSADPLGQTALAMAISATIDSYVTSAHMRVDWLDCCSVVPKLRHWVEKDLNAAVTMCLSQLMGSKSVNVPARDLMQWQQMAVENLGRRRIENLLTYVHYWSRSLGAILDIKEYINSPESKLRLVQSFIKQMSQRVFHAGVRTAELLTIYTNIIHVLKTLDSRGVLLERVAQPLRSYLRDREDTVKVIAASFLADMDDAGQLVNASDDVCPDITQAVRVSEMEEARPSKKALDFDDMNWEPDPFDAGPDFKTNDSSDVLSYMLSLFEQDNFIKEVQNILGERLLRTEDSELEKEIRLVELFKSRLGQDKLQTCEVMLRDMQDSTRIMKHVRSQKATRPTARRVYEAIPEDGIPLAELIKKVRGPSITHKAAQSHLMNCIQAAAVLDKKTKIIYRKPNPELGPAEEGDTSTDFYAQILSSFFWPALREEDFVVPAPITAAQQAFESEFERLKNLRKLKWLHALGRANVELELTDRTLSFEGVHTWQAAVVYAFEDEAGNPVSKTAEQLVTDLEMDDLLVRNALSFWTARKVLTTNDNETYSVLETLPTDTDAAEAQQTSDVDQQMIDAEPMDEDDSAAIGAVKSASAILKDNRAMYEMFLVGMLTNGGSMDAGRIAMMMGMVVPGGFPGSADDVRWLLQGLMEQGKVVKSAGSYAIKK